MLCKTGKVRVEVEKSEVILLPNEQAVLEGSKLIENTNTNVMKVLSWQENKFYFENASLLRVLKELERQYAVDIEPTNIDGMSYTGMFVKSEKIEHPLQVICKPLGLQYELVDNEYRIAPQSLE